VGEACHRGAAFAEDRRDLLGIFAIPGLLAQHAGCEVVLVEAALHDALDGLFGLARHLRIVRDLAAEEREFLLDLLGGNVVPAQDLGLRKHDVLAEFLGGRRQVVGRTTEGHERPLLAVVVDVGAYDAVAVDGEAGDLTDLHVLADEADEAAQRVLDRVVAFPWPVVGEEGIAFTDPLLVGEVREFVHELDELGGALDGLRLALDQHHRAGLAVVGDAHRQQTFAGGSSRTLLGRLEAQLAEAVHGHLEVATGLDERLLALHHRHAAGLAQLHHLLRTDIHLLDLH